MLNHFHNIFCYTIFSKFIIRNYPWQRYYSITIWVISGFCFIQYFITYCIKFYYFIFWYLCTTNQLSPRCIHMPIFSHFHNYISPFSFSCSIFSCSTIESSCFLEIMSALKDKLLRSPSPLNG